MAIVDSTNFWGQLGYWKKTGLIWAVAHGLVCNNAHELHGAQDQNEAFIILFKVVFA